MHKPGRPEIQSDIDAGREVAEVLQVHAEQVTVAKRSRRRLVRAIRTTQVRDEVVEENLASERVVVERVPIGQIVEAMPPVRQEDDVTIVPVVEEIVVVERRLFLKEEVRLQRVRTTERFVETVRLREQMVEITRTDFED